MVQAGVTDLQLGQCDAGIVFLGRGTDRADEEVPVAADSLVWADEPEQLRDGSAAVCERGSDRADDEGGGGV